MSKRAIMHVLLTPEQVAWLKSQQEFYEEKRKFGVCAALSNPVQCRLSMKVKLCIIVCS